jgi:hypothetical protein
MRDIQKVVVWFAVAISDFLLSSVLLFLVMCMWEKRLIRPEDGPEWTETCHVGMNTIKRK